MNLSFSYLHLIYFNLKIHYQYAKKILLKDFKATSFFFGKRVISEGSCPNRGKLLCLNIVTIVYIPACGFVSFIKYCCYKFIN